jgi:hypothetical protein
MEVIILTIWKICIIVAGFVFVSIVTCRIFSRINHFVKRKFTSRKRHSRSSRKVSESGYSTPAMDKI